MFCKSPMWCFLLQPRPRPLLILNHWKRCEYYNFFCSIILSSFTSSYRTPYPSLPLTSTPPLPPTHLSFLSVSKGALHDPGAYNLSTFRYHETFILIVGTFQVTITRAHTHSHTHAHTSLLHTTLLCLLMSSNDASHDLILYSPPLQFLYNSHSCTPSINPNPPDVILLY